MASRTGILSDAHSDKFCLEFNAAPLGYFQATYNELPMNPNLPGIKTPRYVQTVNKPVSLDVAAVNLGKLLHRNSHASSSFVLDRMVDNVQDFSPPKVTIVPPQGTNTPVASIVPNLTRPSREAQIAVNVSGLNSGELPRARDKVLLESRQASMSTPLPTAAASTPNPDLFERTSMSGSLRQSERVRDEAAASALRAELETTPASVASRIAAERLRRSAARSPMTGSPGAPNTAQQNRRDSVADAMAASLFAEMEADRAVAGAEPQRRQRLTADQRAMQEAQTFMATSHY